MPFIENYTRLTIGTKKLMINDKKSGKFFCKDPKGQVQVEVSNSVIRTMMIESQLAGEELHCLNQESKEVIKRILLDKLARSIYLD